MNIKDYIQSGIIESYVLGLSTIEEQREFESVCDKYAEIKQAKIAFEIALEEELNREALSPPEFLKETILQSLFITGKEDLLEKIEAPKIPSGSINFWKWIATACIALLIVGAYMVYTLRDKYQQLQAANTSLEPRLNDSLRNDAIIALNPIVQKPSVKWSTMVEPANTGHCMAHIYWDSLSSNTWLMLGNIPKPLADKQFQLWALVDNQPASLGIFDNKTEGQLVQMKNINKGKTFLITIEPKGGSATPSLNAIYARGQL